MDCLNNYDIISMISDTMSQPTKKMRDAMHAAQVDDDERDLDKNFKRLERRVAELTGKEDSIFMPSGMMSNIVAVMVHCPLRHHEVLIGDESDMEHCEQGSITQVACRSHRILKTKPDGTYDFENLVQKIRPPNNNHYTVTRLICIENTNNRLGGVVVPMVFLKKLSNFAKSKNLFVHLDGARVWNAAIRLEVPLKEIAQYADSISFCIYKGLGAPAGSMLSGSRNFINQARYIRKMLGGAQRKTGFLAVAGLIAIDGAEQRLREDHKHAIMIAEAINSVGKDKIFVNMDLHHTNIVSIQFKTNFRVKPSNFMERLSVVDKMEKEILKDNLVILKGRCHGSGRFQLNLCNNNTPEQINRAIIKLKFVIKQLLDD